VDLRGRVYATFGTNDCHVRVYDEKGELVRFARTATAVNGKREAVPAAITGVIGYGGSLRVDSQGNLYLLQAGLPKGFRPPTGWEKDEAHARAAGTIYKFPPQGGEVHAKGGVVQKVTGAIGQYPGCGPISRWNAVGACACTKPRFDVDGYGRLYVPDGIAFRVTVRDNADNEIVTFGAYGNLDCRGPRSQEPAPAIPLGWPVCVGTSERYIYVGDVLNHRVVRVDRRWAAEVSVKVSGTERDE
jgi:hypothetical protein